MLYLPLLNTQRTVLFIVCLISSCLLIGCATPFERFYKPAVTADGSTVTPAGTPLLLWSPDPDRNGQQLAQEGYVLLGTSSYDGAIDLRYLQEALAQGKKVGAAVVLLKVKFTTASHFLDVGDIFPPGECNWSWACLGPANESAPAFGPIGTTGKVFASYWAKASSS